MNLFQIILTTFLLAITRMGCTQPPADRPPVKNPAFDEKISQTIRFTVPTIGVKTLKTIREDVLIFDTRKMEEYEVSHIAGARFLGYPNPDPAQLENVEKDQKIVLYCSIGYRSEKMGEKLRALGYTNVYNLYGSIFEWVNQGEPVVTMHGDTTQQVHTYNRNWSKWIDENRIEKVW